MQIEGVTSDATVTVEDTGEGGDLAMSITQMDLSERALTQAERIRLSEQDQQLAGLQEDLALLRKAIAENSDQSVQQMYRMLFLFSIFFLSFFLSICLASTIILTSSFVH